MSAAPLLYNAKGEPIATLPSSDDVKNPDKDASEGHESGTPSRYDQFASWHAGGPSWLGSRRELKLPDGVSLAYDKENDVWTVRDEYLVNPVLGASQSKETAEAALVQYADSVWLRIRTLEGKKR